jgi:hypothetical protein
LRLIDLGNHSMRHGTHFSRRVQLAESIEQRLLGFLRVTAKLTFAIDPGGVQEEADAIQ